MKLNTYDVAEIAEYSIWALWQRRTFGANYARLKLAERSSQPDNVRKWLYRLSAQSPDSTGLDAALLGELRHDDSARAREGLALGVADLDPTTFANEVLEWYSVEDSTPVRENLLSSMAQRSAKNADYGDAVESRYALEKADSPLRKRLLAASEGTPIYPRLRQISATDARDRQGLLEYGQANIIFKDNTIVTGPTLSVGGNFNAQNVAVGDMIGSANAAVQQLERSDPSTAKALEDVLELVGQSKTTAAHADVVAAVEQIAKAPTPEHKATLVDRLKSFAATATAAGAAIGGIDKAIEAIQHLTF